MELIDQVCSLELSRQLEALGVLQDSFWKYLITISNHIKLEWSCHDRAQFEKVWGTIKESYSAFTSSELGMILPVGIYTRQYLNKSNPHYNKNSNWFCIRHETDMDKLNGAATEANARAERLKYLLENKLITLGN